MLETTALTPNRVYIYTRDKRINPRWGSYIVEGHMSDSTSRNIRNVRNFCNVRNVRNVRNSCNVRNVCNPCNVRNVGNVRNVRNTASLQSGVQYR